MNDAPRRVLAAVSGGADSVALLVRLSRLGADVVAAHYNHGIRGAEADADEEFVRGLAAKLGVPFEAGRGDVPAEAARTGESIEMAARRMRYAFLYAAAARHGCEAIATGHNLDDRVETFFLRLKRGAGLRGLAGIAAFTPGKNGAPALWRPLLGLRHAELTAFLARENIPWREDSTNAGDEAERNRVRHRILPEFERAFGKSVFRTIARTMDNIRDELDGGRTPLRDALDWLEANGLPAGFRTKTTAGRVARLLERGENAQVPLGGGAVARLEYGRLEFLAPAHAAQAEEMILRDESCAAPLRPARVPGLVADSHECTVDAEEFRKRAPVLRHWRHGDRMTAAGSGVSKKLSDIFTSLKIPKDVRAALWLLADPATGEVLWLPGYAVSALVADRPGRPMRRLSLSRR